MTNDRSLVRVYPVGPGGGAIVLGNMGKRAQRRPASIAERQGVTRRHFFGLKAIERVMTSKKSETVMMRLMTTIMKLEW